MVRKNKSRYKRKKEGIALVIAMVFITIFSSLAIAMFTMSTNNTIVADNFHQANEALAAAESGLETVRYWVGQVVIPGLTPEYDRFTELADQLVTVMNSEFSSQTVAYFHNDAYEPHVHIGFSSSPVTLSNTGSFYARITGNGTGGFNVEITGQSGDMTRTIYTGFTYGVREHNVFDYGVASKGAVATQSILLDGVNVSVEADMYIESMTTDEALLLGNSQIAGDVQIVNPDAYVTMTGASSIGGETGTAAIENHVEVGVEPTEFPYPNSGHFEQYVTGVTIDSSNIASYSSNPTLENVRIAAGTNPTFDGQSTINGVIYVEQPNVITFKGTANINGLIVGDGSIDDNSGANQIILEGTVNSSSVASLPADQYGTLTEETGTFIMAPGFAVYMGGSFGTLNGCIACNGLTTYGQAAGTIGGSVLNYSSDPMLLGGDDLYFNRSGITEVPAGFVPEIIVYYNPSAYEEIL